MLQIVLGILQVVERLRPFAEQGMIFYYHFATMPRFRVDGYSLGAITG